MANSAFKKDGNDGAAGTVVTFMGCLLRHSADQSIPNDTETALTWDTETYDSDAMHSGGNPTRITVPEAGKYAIGTWVDFQSAAGGERDLFFWVNGSAVGFSYGTDFALGNASSACFLRLNVDAVLAANDYVEIAVYQNSGGSLNLLATSAGKPAFWVHRIH